MVCVSVAAAHRSPVSSMHFHSREQQQTRQAERAMYSGMFTSGGDCVRAGESGDQPDEQPALQSSWSSFFGNLSLW